MKKFLFGSLIVVLLSSLFGCQQNEALSEDLNLKKSIEGFGEPEP